MCDLGTFLAGVAFGMIGTALFFYAIVRLGESADLIGSCPRCGHSDFAIKVETSKLFCLKCSWSED